MVDCFFSIGKPNVAGLIPGSDATYDSIARILKPGGMKGNGKSSNSERDPLVENFSLAAMAGTSTGEKSGKRPSSTNKLLEKLDEYSDVDDICDLGEEIKGVSEKKETENGSPFHFQPSYFQWAMEDESFNKYAVVLMVLESGLGTSEKIVKAKVENNGTVLRVTTYKPPAVTTLRFLEKACLDSGVPELWVRHLVHEGNKEMEKLLVGTGSTERTRIKTYCELQLKFECERQIVYHIPIHHTKTGCTYHLYILRKKRSEDDKVLDLRRKVLKYDSSEEESDSDLDGDVDSDTELLRSLKKSLKKKKRKLPSLENALP
jgi:hypothetical protein